MKIKVVDKIVEEWAFRCKKGYPDMKNVEDLEILKEIYSELGVESGMILQENEEQEEITVDTITDLLAKNKDNNKLLQRVYRTLSASAGIDQIKQVLSNAGINKDTFSNRNLPAEVISILIRGTTNDIPTFLKAISESTLKTRGNVKDGLKGLPQGKIRDLANLTGAKDSVNIGKGEILFPLIFSNVKLNTTSAGDFIINGAPAELKANTSRLSGDRANVKYSPYNEEAKGTWSKSLKSDIALGKQKGNLQDVIENMNSFIESTYPSSTVFVTNGDENPVKVMVKAAIDSYIKKKRIVRYILFNHETGDYRTYLPATDILDAVESGEVKYSVGTNPQLKSFR